MSPLIAPGQLIDDKFRIKSTIGFGGMATVVLAVDTSLDREVALKFLAKSLLGDPTWRERFIVEAKNMARVRHENVMPVHSFGLHVGWPYFVMDYVPGGNLSEWRRVNLHPSIAFVSQIVDQVAAGLDAIHAASLVHHDVKPANILMSREGGVVLTDLGLSRVVSGSVRDGKLAGTPRYMAPEQARDMLLSAELAPRTDVYQLGVTAFELLVGSVPFDSRNTLAFGQGPEQPPPTPSSLRPDLGTAIDAVLLTALAPNPEARFSSAGAFAQALAKAAMLPSAFRVLAHPSRPFSLLVADDDPVQLDLCRRLLADAFPSETLVTAVGDGALALAAMKEREYDVVLLDLHMPSMGAFEVVSALARSNTVKPRIIVMTAEGGSNDWQRLRPLGVESMLLKPFDIEQLVASVARRPMVISSKPPRSAA